jgi:putative nucleotidyltransferase with HDIG domain
VAAAVLGIALYAAPRLSSLPLAALAAMLTALIALANLFPLEVARRRKVSVSTAAIFTTVLVLPPPLAIGAAVLAIGLSNLGLLARRRRAGFDVLFNAGQTAVYVGSGALLFGLVRERLLPDAPPSWVLAVALATLAMYLLNSGLVSGAIALLGRRPLREVWLLNRRRDIFQQLALFLTGLVGALLARDFPQAIPILAVPVAVVYLSLKKSLLLLVQTVDAVEALADVVDLRDPYTHAHSKRVADYAVEIARRLQLPAEEVENIRLAARVHDLGKIGVPDHILRKPGPLTDDEWQEMRKHTEVGAELVSKFPEFRRGRELIWCHHERADGQGYPRALAGKQVPIGARIIAVADAWDAMTTDRPYRKAMPQERALAILSANEGPQWDPRAVAVFLDWMRPQVFAASASGGLQMAPTSR